VCVDDLCEITRQNGQNGGPGGSLRCHIKIGGAYVQCLGFFVVRLNKSDRSAALERREGKKGKKKRKRKKEKKKSHLLRGQVAWCRRPPVPAGSSLARLGASFLELASVDAAEEAEAEVRAVPEGDRAWTGSAKRRRSTQGWVRGGWGWVRPRWRMNLWAPAWRTASRSRIWSSTGVGRPREASSART
jgi:hypothetical protein